MRDYLVGKNSARYILLKVLRLQEECFTGTIETAILILYIRQIKKWYTSELKNCSLNFPNVQDETIVLF